MDFSIDSIQSLRQNYGYKTNNLNLDCNQNLWHQKLDQPWSRPVDIKVAHAIPKNKCPLTPADAERFTRVSREGFQYIAKKHCFNTIEMWQQVSDALVIVGMHHDDLQDVQELLFGWKDLSLEMLERYRWRYPERCPLLDALCTMDSSCEDLNSLQDWLLELKGSKDRRRLDLLPALPDPDGVRTPLLH